MKDASKLTTEQRIEQAANGLVIDLFGAREVPDEYGIMIVESMRELLRGYKRDLIDTIANEN